MAYHSSRFDIPRSKKGSGDDLRLRSDVFVHAKQIVRIPLRFELDQPGVIATVGRVDAIVTLFFR